MKRLTFALALFVTSLAASLPAGAGVIAWWPLDNDANDASGNGHDGSVVGGTVNFGQAGANGATGLSASFPNQGHIDVPYAAAIEDGKVLRRYTMIDLEEPEMGRSLRELGVVK